MVWSQSLLIISKFINWNYKIILVIQMANSHINPPHHENSPKYVNTPALVAVLRVLTIKVGIKQLWACSAGMYIPIYLPPLIFSEFIIIGCSIIGRVKRIVIFAKFFKIGLPTIAIFFVLQSRSLQEPPPF